MKTAQRLLPCLLACLPLLAWPAFAQAPAVPAAAAAACPPQLQPPDAAQLESIRQRASDRGLLWKLQRDGRTSWLYGTLHVGRLDWLAPGPRVLGALRDSDELAVELDLTDPQIQREMAASALSRPQELTLPEALRSRLARQAEAACLPAGALERLHPVMQAVTLAVLDARWEGLDAGLGQEFVLIGGMRALGRPVRSLEAVATQAAALIPAERAQALAMVDQSLRQLEQRRSRPVVRRLAEAWSQGRLAELEAYEQWCDCIDSPADREFMRRLNDSRNGALAKAIAARHAAGQRVFAAVGALHMVGPQALPRLLAAEGFAVERVVFGTP